MLLNAPRVSPGARALQSRATFLRSSAASNSILDIASRQQYREFRLGLWASGSDDSPAEPRRRPRSLRYRYMESITRNLSWGNIPGSESSRAAMKKAMEQFTKAGNRYINVDEVKSWSDEVSGVRPGKNIEDVERNAIDHLFQRKSPASHEYSIWNLPLRSIRNRIGKQGTVKDVTPEEVLHATTGGEQSPIDPISNRRTYKYEDLDKYKPVMDGEKDPQKQKQEEYDDLDKYGPIRWNEPDGLQKPTPEEDSKKYKDLDKYASSRLDNPLSQRQLSSEEQSKAYDDLHKYSAVRWNEPDGLRKMTAEELSKNYDDLHEYKAVRWNEPDGLREPTPEELSKSYQDLAEYGPVAWSEPDGLRRLTPEEQSKTYDDLEHYNSPFTAENSALKAHELSQMDATPKAEPLAAPVKVASEDPAKQYNDLDKYGPVMWNEPDGLRKLTPEELSKNYEDLHLYGATRWNEPNGLRKLTPEEQSKRYPDLSAYAPRDNTPPSSSRHPEELSRDYKDLDKYAQYTKGNSIRVHLEEVSKQYDDLHMYNDFRTGRPNLHPEEASKQYEDLSKYPTGNFKEPSKTTQVHPEELTKTYRDLNDYDFKNFDSAYKLYPIHPEEASKQYKDLQYYEHSSAYQSSPSSMGSQPDGNFSSSGASGNGSNDNGSKAGSPSIPDGSLHTHRRRGSKAFADSTDTSAEVVDTLTAQDIRTSALRKDWQGNQKQSDSSKAEYDVAWDEVTEAAFEGLQNFKRAQETRKGLTSNYIRDFPEEFSTSWTEVDSYKPTLLPESQAKEAAARKVAVKCEQRDTDEFASMDESFPALEPRIQSSLARGAKKRSTTVPKVSDSYSKDPQGLETSFAEENVGEAQTSPVVKHYGAETVHESGTAEATATLNQEPALYKIIAYDPETRYVNIAETTSAVHNAGSLSTPAEVLLKLDHPSKFLPHFEPLEADGYEIVSGGGNALVFRKARPASSTTSFKKIFSQMAPTRINPIDMMGKPASANFASPTGFVNYEHFVGESRDKPAPPFQSSTSYSQSRESKSQESTSVNPRKRRGIGKKVVMGTIWVAGSAYAVGVVGEYFGSGGKASERGVSKRS